MLVIDLKAPFYSGAFLCGIEVASRAIGETIKTHKK